MHVSWIYMVFSSQNSFIVHDKWKWVRIPHFLPESIAFYQSALCHYLPEDVRQSSHPPFSRIPVNQVNPIQSSDRILFEVGGVLLNLSFGNTPWFDSTLRNKGWCKSWKREGKWIIA